MKHVVFILTSGCASAMPNPEIEKMVKKVSLLVLCFFLVGSVCVSEVFCQRVRPVSRVNDSGDVQGVVECPLGTPIEGAWVYIPGHSFRAVSNRQGFFKLHLVPESVEPYTLAIEIAPETVFTINGIIVRGKRVTDLGTIVACSSGCEDNSACPKGYYCEKAIGDCDGVGVCTVRPVGVFRYIDLVCGCDGVTYMNKELAAKEGVSLASYGPCENQNPCYDNGDCAVGYYCAKEEGDCDGTGTCTEKPTAWIEIYAPVCGCDGQTYSNEGEAAGHGVTIDYQGECHEQ